MGRKGKRSPGKATASAKSASTRTDPKNEAIDAVQATIFFLRTQEEMLKSHVCVLNATYLQRIDDKCTGKFVPPPMQKEKDSHSESGSEDESSSRTERGKSAGDHSTSSRNKARSPNKEPGNLLKMLKQKEDAERSDLFGCADVNYGCIAELSACYRIGELLKMCTDLASIVNALHRSLNSMKAELRSRGLEAELLLGEAIRLFRVTNAISEVFSIMPFPRSKLLEEGVQFKQLLSVQDEMSFFEPCNEGLQIVADPEQYILKFEAQIDHMRTAVNEIGKCLSNTTKILRSINTEKEKTRKDKGKKLVEDVTEHKIEKLLERMPPRCGQTGQIELSMFSAKLLATPPRDKPCLPFLEHEEDPCVLAEELLKKLVAGEQVWDWEKGPFVCDSDDDEVELPVSSRSASSRDKTTGDDNTQGSSRHSTRRRSKRRAKRNTSRST